MDMLRLLKAECLKTKRTKLLLTHLLVPIAISGLFLVEQQMKALSLEKNLEVSVEMVRLPTSIMIEEELFYRALLNVIVNAVEHTPNNGKVTLFVQGKEDVIHFTVKDSGTGFSSKDLIEATKQFYREDQSRNTTNHHGMGLYIAESIIKKHDGVLTLANDSITGGGKVTVTLLVISME